MTGRIEVVTGSMFSGKTEELVRRLRRAGFARRRVVVIKPVIDDRYHATKIGSHTGILYDAITVNAVEEILHVVGDAQVVGIDEAQFFTNDLVWACDTLANRGIQVIVAGLDMDSDGVPFGPIPALMAIAEDVLKLQAVCVVCGEAASKSFHRVGKQAVVEVGVRQYEARCRSCFRGAK